MNIYAFDKDKEKKDRDPVKLKYSLESGYSFGGQFVNESFIFESGIAFQLETHLIAASRIYYGIGLGYEKYDTESFIPIFLSFKGLTKKKNEGPFLSFQMGYSFAWDKDFSNYENYNYIGGLLFSTGIGRMFDLMEKYSILLNFSLKHQFVRIDYETFDSNIYTETINYDMISIKIGFMF